jgi:hypothetical protein
LGGIWIFQQEKALLSKFHVGGVRWWRCGGSLCGGDPPIQKINAALVLYLTLDNGVANGSFNRWQAHVHGGGRSGT